jgi:MFS family permease
MAGLAFLGSSAGAALGGAISGRLAASRPPILAMGMASVLAALSLAAVASGSWFTYLPALTACGFTLGLVYAFTTVATQAVVRPERAGEAAGVTLTALVTLAGVGVAVSEPCWRYLSAPDCRRRVRSARSSRCWRRYCYPPVRWCC